MRNLLLKAKLSIPVFLLSFSFLACSHTTPFFSDKLPVKVVPPAEATKIESTIFLIGDAGEPTAEPTEPTLLTLTRHASLAPEKSMVVFLGDNVYPAGLPDSSSPHHAEMERRLLQQLLVIKYSAARGIFIPGNHDWDRYGDDGWNAVKRQEAFVEKTLGAQGDFLPPAGCPGPEIVDVGETLRIIVLDTQWWLHKGNKPRHPNSNCAADSKEEIVASLYKAMAEAGQRQVLIAAHHPLASHGIHGGFFGWRDHLFPLLNFSKYLWVPLPGVGSLYPLVRSFGVSNQDLAGPDNKKMRQALEAVFKTSPPLAYASGHEHNLQILTHAGIVNHLIVSGNGTITHSSPVSHGQNTLFAHQHTGFVKLDFLNDGRVRLGVIEPREQGREDAEIFSMWLRDSTQVGTHQARPAATGHKSPASYERLTLDPGIGLSADGDAMPLHGDGGPAPQGPLTACSGDSEDLYASDTSEVDDTTKIMDSTRTITPGARYKAGGLHKFFFGAHHRNLWTTPITVPLLNLGTFAGGLTPIKRGGGFQTKSLRFRDANGIQWQFRSIDKDPSKVLPGELQQTIAKNIIQDQVSSSHPYSALVVKRLAAALGILHAEPILAVLPDDPRLGEYRTDFGGMFGLIEERPTDGPDDEPGFAGSEKIGDSSELFEELDQDNDDLVNPRAFLTARLLDIFVGDWDRHVDQWRWARFKEDGKGVWYPIPRDRDQAFAYFDGLFPSLTDKRWVVRQMEGYNKDKPDVISLTHSGRHLDRRILSRLAEDEWRHVTKEAVSKLTDAVLDEAVRNLPPEVYTIDGAKLLGRLKSRRDHLPEASDQFYKYLARYIDVHLSNKNEFVDIDRHDNGNVAVTAYKRDKHTGEKKTKDIVFQRTFKYGETAEVRLYMMGGDDKVDIAGKASSSITVRVSGGAGDDQYADRSKVAGYFLGTVPFIPDAEKKTFFYDGKEGSSFVSGPSTKIYTRHVEEKRAPLVPPPPKFSSEKPAPERRDYGHDVWPVPFFGYTPDEGIFLGGGPSTTRYGFRKDPYAYKLGFFGSYAFTSGAFRIALAADVIDVLPDVRLSIDGQIYVPRSVRNFYGFGNDITRNADLEDDDFYKVKSDDYALRQKLNFKLHNKIEWYVGSGYSFTRIKRKDSPFVNMLSDSVDLYGAGKFRQFHVSTGIQIDTRDRAVASRRGFYGSMEVVHYPDLLDLDDNYTRLKGEARVYFSDTLLTDFTLAIRLGGQKLWGTFPFFEAAFLGGKSDLRGFRFQRFAGDAAAWGNADLRFFLKRIWMIFPADFGLFTFADAGRVWLDGNSPGDWHTDIGGGIWIAPVYRAYTMSIGAGLSNEATQIIASLGFAF